MDIPFSDKTDEELAELSLNSQIAFSNLIKRYEKRLLRYIKRISGFSDEEAEDSLQDAFVKMYRYLANFDTSLSFSAWAYRIVHNQVISQYRKNKIRAHGNSIHVSDDFIAQFPDSLNIEEDADNELLSKYLKSVLDKIDIKYREVLVLYYFEERSYQEISDILMKPSGTIATLLNRAKKKCLIEIKSRKKI